MGLIRYPDNSVKREPLSLLERDPVGYYLGEARIEAAKRLTRIVSKGLDGTLLTSNKHSRRQHASMKLGLTAALAVLGLPRQQPQAVSLGSSVTINLGQVIQASGGTTREPGTELRPGGLTLSLGQRNGEPGGPNGHS